MSHHKVPVFLSWGMNTREMQRLRREVRDLFATNVGITECCELYCMEDGASDLAPPPATSLIQHEGLFILIMGDDREAVRGEIIDAQSKKNKFFMFFWDLQWDENSIQEYLAEMDLLDKTYATFNDPYDLREGIRDSISNYAVKTMMSYDRNRVDLLIQAAQYALAAKRFSDARRNYEEAIAREPSNFDAHFGLGYILTRYLQRAEQAVEHFATCKRLKPQSLESSFDLAVALSHVPTKREKAIVEYLGFLATVEQFSISDQNTQLLVGKALIFLSETRIQSNMQDAVEHATKELLDGARLLRELQDFAEARHWFGTIPARIENAIVYLDHRGRKEEVAALRDFSKVCSSIIAHFEQFPLEESTVYGSPAPMEQLWGEEPGNY